MPDRARRAYIITIGVNSYARADRNLSFAAKEAVDLGTVLSTIKADEVVPLTLVSDDARVGKSKIRQATKQNIRTVLELLSGRSESDRARLLRLPGIDARAIDRLRKVTPDDVVIIAFSGHGYTDPTSGEFYMLPSDSGTGPAGDVASLRTYISSKELSLWLRDVDAGEMALIIDACHSAASVEGRGFRPGPMGTAAWANWPTTRG